MFKSDKLAVSVLLGAVLTLVSPSVLYAQAGVSITETGGSTSVSESGPTSDTYTIVLDAAPTADVSIVATPDTQTDVGAGAGIGVLLTFTSANWNTPQTITVTAVDDALVEGVHSSTITHIATSADPAYDGLGISNVVVSVTDNDSVGVTITTTGGSSDVSETGPTSDSYTIVLTSMPTATVTITVDPDVQTDVGNGAGAAVTVNISPGTWNIARTVIVTAVDDAVPEGPHTSTIVHTATSADGGYNGIAIANVTVNVTDNDAAGVSIVEAGGSTDVSEQGPTSDTYTITLDKQPTADVTVTATPDAQVDLGAGAGVAVSFVFTVATWNVARSVTVTAVDDIVDEGFSTSTIVHSTTSGDSDYNGIATASVVVNVTDNDRAGVTITPSGGSTDVSEVGPTSDTYTVVLDSPPTATVTIQIDPDVQVDVGAGTGTAINLSFTTGNWNTSQTITVTAVDDAVAEGAHTSTITHTASSGDANYNGIAIASVVANVADNDTAGVSVTQSANSTAVNEQGPTSDTYTVVLLSQPTANVVVTVDPDIQTSVGAGAGVAGILTFTAANWSTAQTVTVSAVDDFIIEGNHSSTITHTATSADGNYNGISIANVVATITDNDAAGVTISESGGSTDVSEIGPTSDTYTLVLDAQPNADVTITVTPDTNTDLGSGGGVAITEVFTSANWNTPRTIVVTAVDDANQEGQHTSTISHTTSSADANYNGLSVSSVTANVVDNDLPGVSLVESGGSTAVSEAGTTSDSFTIVLQSPPTASVSITVDPDVQTDVGAGAGAAVVVVFTGANWSTAQVVLVTAVDDNIAEGNHTSTIVTQASSVDPSYNGISVADVTATVSDNDTVGVVVVESGGSTDVNETGPTSDTYTVVLSSEPTANVTITVDPDTQTDVGAGAGATVDLTFTAGNWNVAQTVTVTAIDDATPEGLHTSTIVHTAASGDSNYNGISIAGVTANVTDNDAPGVTVTASGGSTDVNETGPTSDTYTIVLDSQPIADVTITVDPDTQTDIGAGTGTAISLTFTSGNWNTAQTVTVTAVDDAIDEGAHTSTIAHTSVSADSDYQGIAINAVTVNVTDNDTAGVTITESGGSSDVNETGTTSDTYTVVLTSQPTADVTITVDPDTQTDVGVGVGAAINLTFTSANWNTAQTVTVTAVDDAVDEGMHTSTITHTAASADAKYQGIAIASVAANVSDDDTAGVTVTESGASTDISETGPTSDTYTIVLESQPTADVTITVDPDTQTDVGAGVGATINLTFTSANWNTAQTVTVTAVDDAVDEGTHTSTITHAAASPDAKYQGISIASVTANITDNDAAGVTITESGASTDVDEAGPTSDAYTVVLKSQPTADVTITVDPDIQTSVGAGGGAAISLTFTSGNWNVAQSVTVTAVDDAVDENVHPSAITHTAASADANYQGITIASITANVTDNDTAGVTITESGGSTDVSENGPSSDTYTLVLASQPTANVTITVDPDTQTDLGAGVGAATSLTFTSANWNTAQTVTVTAVSDGVPEGPHTSSITHTATSSDPLYDGISVSSVVAAVTDAAGVALAETSGSTDVAEDGPTSDSYTIVLNNPPSADVTIVVDPTSQLDVGSGAGVALLVTFTTANWSTAQTVTVMAVDDSVVEGTHTSIIAHSAVSADTGYDNLSIANVLVTITDNDTQSGSGGGGGGGGGAGVPIARDQKVATDEDTPVAFELRRAQNAGTQPTYFVIDQPLHGVLQGQPPNLVYTPGKDFFGADSLTYVVARGDAASNIAEVAIDVWPVNDPPRGFAQTIQVAGLPSIPITLGGFDTEVGTDVDFEIENGPSHGQLLGKPPLVRYSPDAEFIGIDEFTYTVTDGELVSEPVSIRLEVAGGDAAAQEPSDGDGTLGSDVMAGDGGGAGHTPQTGPSNGTRRPRDGICGALDGVSLSLCTIGWVSLKKRRRSR